MEVGIGLASECGARSANEDYAAVYLGTAPERARHGVLAVIADGVGGARGGRVAAELAVRGLVDGYLSGSELLSVRRKAGVTLTALNQWIFAQGRADLGRLGMATTCSALILRGRLAHVVHVGDTRIYRLRGSELERLTTDHTPGKAGLANVLTRALGAEETVRLDYGVEPILVHDRFLLCSDGVHGALSEAQLAALLSQRATPETTARHLVNAALATTQGDNATAVVLDVLSLAAPDRTDLEQTIASRPILPAPSPGTTVDGFELGQVLSDGRYSRVFKAVDRATSSEVVLKFPKEVVAAESIYRQAFVREAWVANRVRSPWIGEVLDPGPERQTCLYTVMPLYAGTTLEQRLHQSPPISFVDGVAIAVKLARAAATLHRAGIIHRDIKPDNVILEHNGGLRLVDLGVAKLPELEDFPASHAPGTPSYMAPELFAGGTGDERSDQFALGVTIYRLFSGGAYPYGEIEPFSHPRFRKATPLNQHRPDLPAWLDRALERTIAVLPEARFGDLLELAQELEHGLARGAPTRLTPRSLYDRDPLRFWQIVAALLGLVLLATCALPGWAGA
jgi:serine/threonine protein phosphatase PrpC